MLAVSEMLIHLTFPCGNRYLHQLLSFLVNSDFSAFNAEELSIDDGIGHLAAPGRLPRCAQMSAARPPFGGQRPPGEAIQVGQADGFRFVQAEDHFRKRAALHPRGLEGSGRDAAPYPASFKGRAVTTLRLDGSFVGLTI